jgi:hypothetical protein
MGLTMKVTFRLTFSMLMFECRWSEIKQMQAANVLFFAVITLVDIKKNIKWRIFCGKLLRLKKNDYLCTLFRMMLNSKAILPTT